MCTQILFNYLRPPGPHTDVSRVGSIICTLLHVFLMFLTRMCRLVAKDRARLCCFFLAALLLLLAAITDDRPPADCPLAAADTHRSTSSTRRLLPLPPHSAMSDAAAAAAPAAASSSSSSDPLHVAKGWPEQIIANLDASQLTPLSEVAMHRQATINIGQNEQTDEHADGPERQTTSASCTANSNECTGANRCAGVRVECAWRMRVAGRANALAAGVPQCAARCDGHWRAMRWLHSRSALTAAVAVHCICRCVHSTSLAQARSGTWPTASRRW